MASRVSAWRLTGPPVADSGGVVGISSMHLSRAPKEEEVSRKISRLACLQVRTWAPRSHATQTRHINARGNVNNYYYEYWIFIPPITVLLTIYLDLLYWISSFFLFYLPWTEGTRIWEIIIISRYDRLVIVYFIVWFNLRHLS